MATPGWVSRFLWYLARAARRKFGFCNRVARTTEKILSNAILGQPFCLVSGARSVKKILLCNLVARTTEKILSNARLGHPFSLLSGARSAEQILALLWCRKNAKEQRSSCKKTKVERSAESSLDFFVANPISETTFFLYVKLLISLLNIAIFRLGENFSKNSSRTQFLALYT